MIPYYKQEKDWYCGPAVMQMILASQKIMVSQNQLARELKTTKSTGTDNANILNCLKKRAFEYEMHRGFNPNTVLNKLKNKLNQKKIVLVTYWHLADKTGHFAIVRKITKKTIILQDPDKGPKYTLKLPTFLKAWRDSEGNAHWHVAIKPKVQ
jgi:ABC-type bacteriocin/lantibiotic exporter with double-glycine peptidase domain